MESFETQYAKSGDLYLAYQVWGDGEIDVLEMNSGANFSIDATADDSHFARYVDDGRLPGWLLVLSRHGRIVHLSTYGSRDIEAGLPVENDTLFRLYSMTKPVTSVAAMMLYEQGAFELNDPVSRFIPSFADARVFRSGTAAKPVTDPVVEPMRIWHLLTHMAGLTYGFHYTHVVDAMYRQAGFEWGAPKDLDLEACCDAWAALPLLFQPGAEWNYSVATDVLGRVVEVASGQSLDRYFSEKSSNRSACPRPVSSSTRRPPDAWPRSISRPQGRGGHAAREPRGIADGAPPRLSGGGGLIGSAADYHRFSQMLLRGGELDGARLLGTADGLLHDPQPPPRRRRPRDHRAPPVRRDHVRRCRLRTRLLGTDRPGQEQGAVTGR